MVTSKHRQKLKWTIIEDNPAVGPTAIQTWHTITLTYELGKGTFIALTRTIAKHIIIKISVGIIKSKVKINNRT